MYKLRVNLPGVQRLQIGDEYLGGTVIYINEGTSTDIYGIDPAGGIVAKTFTDSIWSNVNAENFTADFLDLESPNSFVDGRENTTAIVNQPNHTTSAASLVSADGFYLPALYEIINIWASSSYNESPDSRYWTSTIDEFYPERAFSASLSYGLILKSYTQKVVGFKRFQLDFSSLNYPTPDFDFEWRYFDNVIFDGASLTTKKENNTEIMRTKVDGDIVIYGDDYDIMKWYEENTIKYFYKLEAEIYELDRTTDTYTKILDGELILNGNYNEDEKKTSLSFAVVDIYTNIFSNYDKEIDVTALESETSVNVTYSGGTKTVYLYGIESMLVFALEKIGETNLTANGFANIRNKFDAFRRAYIFKTNDTNTFKLSEFFDTMYKYFGIYWQIVDNDIFFGYIEDMSFGEGIDARSLYGRNWTKHLSRYSSPKVKAKSVGREIDAYGEDFKGKDVLMANVVEGEREVVNIPYTFDLDAVLRGEDIDADYGLVSLYLNEGAAFNVFATVDDYGENGHRIEEYDIVTSEIEVASGTRYYKKTFNNVDTTLYSIDFAYIRALYNSFYIKIYEDYNGNSEFKFSESASPGVNKGINEAYSVSNTFTARAGSVVRIVIYSDSYYDIDNINQRFRIVNFDIIGQTQIENNVNNDVGVLSGDNILNQPFSLSNVDKVFTTNMPDNEIIINGNENKTILSREGKKQDPFVLPIRPLYTSIDYNNTITSSLFEGKITSHKRRMNNSKVDEFEIEEIQKRYLLNEDGSYLLYEDGNRIEME